MKRIILLLIPALAVWGFGQCVEVAIEYVDSECETAFSGQYRQQVLIEGEQNAKVLSFGFKGGSTPKLDLSIGIGVRKQIDDLCVGLHLFTDYSHLYNSNALQVGIYGEFCSNFWDVYFNSYCPLTPDKRTKGTQLRYPYYLDGGIVLRFPECELSLIPNVFFGDGSWGIVLRSEIPTPFGSFFFDTGKNLPYSDHVRIGFNFYLCNTSSRPYMPIRRHVGVIHIPYDPPIN